MGNVRLLVQFCGVVVDLIIVSFRSKVMVRGLYGRQKRMESVLLIL